MTTDFFGARFHVLSALFLIFAAAPLAAQSFGDKAAFRIETNADTVAKGQAFEVRYIIENAEATTFSLPNFEHFDRVSGPNTSSNISIINGQKKQKIVYSYWLIAPQLGQYELPAIEIPTSAGNLRCEARKLVVSEKGGQKSSDNLATTPNMPLNMDIGQFFNNPQFFNFEMPNFNMPQMPDFNDLFKGFDQLFEQQYKDKLPPKPTIDPKTNQPIYKI